MKRKIICALLAVFISFGLYYANIYRKYGSLKVEKETENAETESAETEKENPEDVEINIGVLSGPTGLGAVFAMDAAESGEYANYNFELKGEATDASAAIINGSLDIAAVPTNLAAKLYQKTEGGVKIICINTLGVLYILENGESVQSVADLKGKTIYAAGQGSNPEYILNYILRSNGLEPGKDVTIEFKETSEIQTLMVSGSADLCMLPVPAATAVLMKNTQVRSALDITFEYEKITEGIGALAQGCLVVRTEFLEEHKDAVDLFLERYSKSVSEVNTNVDGAASLAVKFGIIPSEAIAKAAIPKANICYVAGELMQEKLEGFLNILYESDNASVGAVPDSNFYYVGE